MIIRCDEGDGRELLSFAGAAFPMLQRWGYSLSRRTYMNVSTRVNWRRSIVSANAASKITQANRIRKVGRLQTRDEYLAAFMEVRRLDELYNEGKNTGVRDWEYDALRRRVEQVEKERPEWVGENGPLGGKVGFRASGFRQVRHRNPMLSLANTYSRKEVERFVERTAKIVETGTEYVCELKVDGVALEIVYENGELVVAATRGDGTVGDDVTNNIVESLVNKGVPENLSGNLEGRTEIRGEVYMSREDFMSLNKEESNTLSNARNTVAGILKHKSPGKTCTKRLKFVAYDCTMPEVSPKSMSTHIEKLHALELWGFDAMPRYEVCRSVDEILTFVDAIEEERKNLPLETDGVVIKVNDSKLYESLGRTAKAPRGAVAFKFAASHGITKVQNVVFQVSRTGAINPIACVAPLRVGGVTINRATLHNFDEIERLGVGIGDMVAVERAGDVIPKITRVQEKLENASRASVEVPNKCPSCGTTVVVARDGETNIVRCPNTMRCTAQIKGRIVHFASRRAMDIQGLGGKTADKLIAANLVVTPSDLFRLEEASISTRIEGFKVKSASNLIASIHDAANNRPLSRLINGLGIPGVGETTALVLAKYSGSLQTFRLISGESRDALLRLPNFAEKTVDTIISFLTAKENRIELEALDSLVRMKAENENEDSATKTNTLVSGKSFVFTGSLEKMSRREAADKVVRLKGMIRKTVSKYADYVVVGKQPKSKDGKEASITNKLNKARSMGLTELTEENFETLLSRAYTSKNEI